MAPTMTARLSFWLLLLASAANAQQAQRAELPAGPLLTFATVSNGEPHAVTVHVVGCDGDDPSAKAVWVNRGNVEVLRRLDRDRLLVQSFGEPYGLLVVDAGRGDHRVLCAGGRFVAVHGDDVLYLGDDRWGKGDNFLYARSWRQDAAPARLCESRFLQVPIVAGNLAIGLTAGASEIWAVSIPRRRGRKLYELPADALQPRLALSPSGARLAVGAAAVGRGRLVVVDVGAGTIVREWAELPIDLSPLSSFSPTLEVGWHDEQHVVCSETRGGIGPDAAFVFVRRSLETGEVADEDAYGPVELFHLTPPTPAPPSPPPAFSRERDGATEHLLQRGREQPASSFAWRDHADRVHLSPRRDYAVERAPGQKSFLLHRVGKQPLAVPDSGATQFVWLPAAQK